MDDLIGYLNGYMHPLDFASEARFKQRMVDWLKSLKPQSHWKPSEEQIHAIVEALKYLPNNKDEWRILNTLVDVFKKLM